MYRRPERILDRCVGKSAFDNDNIDNWHTVEQKGTTSHDQHLSVGYC